MPHSGPRAPNSSFQTNRERSIPSPNVRNKQYEAQRKTEPTRSLASGRTDFAGSFLGGLSDHHLNIRSGCDSNTQHQESVQRRYNTMSATGTRHPQPLRRNWTYFKKLITAGRAIELLLLYTVLIPSGCLTVGCCCDSNQNVLQLLARPQDDHLPLCPPGRTLLFPTFIFLFSESKTW